MIIIRIKFSYKCVHVHGNRSESNRFNAAVAAAAVNILLSSIIIVILSLSIAHTRLHFLLFYYFVAMYRIAKTKETKLLIGQHRPTVTATATATKTIVCTAEKQKRFTFCALKQLLLFPAVHRLHLCTIYCPTALGAGVLAAGTNSVFLLIVSALK